MADELPDLSKFDKYLDDEDLEKVQGSGKKSGSGGKGGGVTGSGGGAGSRKGGARRWLWLLIGAALGVAGTIFLPDLLRPHLPPALRLGEEEVAGLVVDKRMEGQRLLLTVDTDRGASLVTFTSRVPEIDLLVAQGDSVTLGLGTYAPLVENPTLAGVRKGPGGEVREPDPTPAGEAREPGAADPVPTAGDTGAVEGAPSGNAGGTGAPQGDEGATAAEGDRTGSPSAGQGAAAGAGEPEPDTAGPPGTG